MLKKKNKKFIYKEHKIFSLIISNTLNFVMALLSSNSLNIIFNLISWNFFILAKKQTKLNIILCKYKYALILSMNCCFSLTSWPVGLFLCQHHISSNKLVVKKKKKFIILHFSTIIYCQLFWTQILCCFLQILCCTAKCKGNRNFLIVEKKT